MTSIGRGAMGLWLAAASLAASAGCSCASEVGARRDGGMQETPDGNGVDVAAPREDAGGSTEPDVGNDAYVDRETFCMGHGPAVIVGDQTIGTATCAGAIASRVFDSAMCTCTDAAVVGYMRTRSFDSGTGMMDTAAGAPVGIDQRDITGGYTDIGGSLVVAGTGGTDFGGYLVVDGDARFGGRVNAAGYIQVHRDLWADGNVTCLGAVTVDRDAHLTPGHNLITFPDVGGSTSHSSFTVEPPCDCTPEGIVDIGAIVDYGRDHNDNADVMLSPSLLANVVGIGVDLTLPCGRFYVDSIGGLGSITLHVHGRTALYVGGDVNALGVLDVDLGTEGELDVFIAGNLLSIGQGSWGEQSRPAATRLYIGGSSTVTLIGASGFVGNVYAPNATITAVGDTEVYGSLFGGNISMPGYLSIHYDRAILDVDRECPPPTECSCDPGQGCVDHTACIGGSCSACTSDADCCAPLVCNTTSGACEPLLI